MKRMYLNCSVPGNTIGRPGRSAQRKVSGSELRYEKKDNKVRGSNHMRDLPILRLFSVGSLGEADLLSRGQ
jgi:hypothetical protein